MSEQKHLPTILGVPDEIIVKILKECLKFPNGIHSERWDLGPKMLVNKIMTAHSKLSASAPEALYASNRVFLKPQIIESYSNMTQSCHKAFWLDYDLPVRITYPRHTEWIKDLEIHIDFGVRARPIERDLYLSPQADWLAKIATGERNFSRLRRLCINFLGSRYSHRDCEYWEHFDLFWAVLKMRKPLVFYLDELRLEFEEPTDNEYRLKPDQARARLSSLLVCKPRLEAPITTQAVK